MIFLPCSNLEIPKVAKRSENQVANLDRLLADLCQLGTRARLRRVDSEKRFKRPAEMGQILESEVEEYLRSFAVRLCKNTISQPQSLFLDPTMRGAPKLHFEIAMEGRQASAGLPSKLVKAQIVGQMFGHEATELGRASGGVGLEEAMNIDIQPCETDERLLSLQEDLAPIDLRIGRKVGLERPEETLE